MPILEIERRFHVDALTDIDALPLVLCRREEKLPERHVARIEIYGAKIFRAEFFREGQFQFVCLQFNLYDFFPRNQFLVGDERPDGSFPDFFPVVVGEAERKRGKTFVFFSVERAEPRTDLFDEFGASREKSHD